MKGKRQMNGKKGDEKRKRAYWFLDAACRSPSAFSFHLQKRKSESHELVIQFYCKKLSSKLYTIA